jgi:hypothetical protein
MAFGVHNDNKSHIGAVMMLGKSCIPTISTKQKVNSRRSMEAELTSMDEMLSQVILTEKYLFKNKVVNLLRTQFTEIIQVQ